jgi:inosine-uridine nucleoside N-ribohydrolase
VTVPTGQPGAARLIIDTDPGMGTVGTDPEDGMAILYALGSSNISVEGITLVQGNVPITHSWPNAVHLLELAGRTDVPVHVGAAQPSAPDRRALQAAWLAQRDRMGRTVPELEPPAASAVEFLCESVARSPGEITVVAIGPLTNIAVAIEQGPEFAASLAGLVIMGGTVSVRGNITPAAEFNLWMDPEAAEVVFDSEAPISMVGLDVCHQTHFTRANAAALRASNSPLARFVADASDSWIDVHQNISTDGEALHLYDSLAMAAAIDPEIIDWSDALVMIETSMGPAEGMTVTHLDHALRQLLTGRDQNARVATRVDVDRFMALFMDRVTSRL